LSLNEQIVQPNPVGLLASTNVECYRLVAYYRTEDDLTIALTVTAPQDFLKKVTVKCSPGQITEYEGCIISRNVGRAHALRVIRVPVIREWQRTSLECWN
jgi:hypothetical protein